MNQIIPKDIAHLKELIVGKKIVDVIKGCSISDDKVAIEEIMLEDNMRIELWGAADCVMIECVWGDCG